MIFLIVYPAVVLFAAYALRRTWKGYAVAALSVVPVAIVTAALQRWLIDDPALRSAVRWVNVLPASYAVLLASMAMLVAHTPRRPASACPGCFYDLTGNQTGLCPECGRAFAEEAREARARRQTRRHGARTTLPAHTGAEALRALNHASASESAATMAAPTAATPPTTGQ